jgi:hypothetical protein
MAMLVDSARESRRLVERLRRRDGAEWLERQEDIRVNQKRKSASSKHPRTVAEHPAGSNAQAPFTRSSAAFEFTTPARRPRPARTG